jgi:GNAT superfamily N-acetyltransferase
LSSIQHISQTDLINVAIVHRAAFPESSLTKLGLEAIRRYYDWQITGPHDCTAFGAFENGSLIGFAFGGVFRGSLSGFVRVNRWFLVSQVMCRPWLLINPIFWGQLKGVGRTFGEKKKQPVSPTHRNPIEALEPPSFGLLAIAVHPRHQSKGVGRLLMQYCEETARHKGFTQARLTVHINNLNAVRFYEQQGWVKTPQNHWQGRMIKGIS